MIILLVENDLQVRFCVRSMLKSEGLTVLTATSGEAALSVFRNYTGPIDLLLTDLEMPGLSGIELYRVIASERPGIKVVLMSGDSSAKAQAEMLGLPFLQKPFDLSAMLSKIRTALGAVLAMDLQFRPTDPPAGTIKPTL